MVDDLRISQLSVGQKILYYSNLVLVVGMKSRSLKIRWNNGFEETIKYKYKHSKASEYKIEKI